MILWFKKMSQITRNNSFQSIRITTTILCLLCGSAWSQGASSEGNLTSDVVLVKVNGVTIPERLLDQALQASVAQGQRDSAELRTAIKSELVARELLSQEALRRGLDKKPAAQDALNAIRQSLLVDLLVNDELEKKPLTDADMQTEYNRQIKALAEISDLKQYQLKVILLKTEAEAQEVIAAAKSGRPFELLAKEKSLDPSNQNGGSLGWVLPGQVVPAISNVMVNLTKGSVSVAPIQTSGGWNVIKVEDTRPFVPPGFEESKPQVRAALIQSRRSALLSDLAKAAKID